MVGCDYGPVRQVLNNIAMWVMSFDFVNVLVLAMILAIFPPLTQGKLWSRSLVCLHLTACSNTAERVPTD